MHERSRAWIAMGLKKVVWAAVTLTVLVLIMGAIDDDLYLRINRGIDLFGKVYKEIALQHVDGIEPDRLMRSGIDGMLRSLDPYTVFLDEDDSDDIDLITTGRYGGIGVSIGMRDGEVVIVSLLEGFSAARQGLQVGDRIVAIDGTPLKGLSMSDVRKLAHGPAGTEVRLSIARENERSAIEFVVLREEIPVRNITYAGFIEPGIAYVRLERFSRTAADDVRSNLKTLGAKETIKGVVLDLRDNPGGLLDIAVEVVAKFVPESSLVVSTRGRTADTERRYYSSERPMLPDVPLAVIVNDNSASASEIVAGAIQDLDRGVVVGTRTFGKGLVQTVSRLTESASLKITTARYYTPSGRCIQEFDYAHRAGNGDATVTPDSLRRIYRTRGGRPVADAGGISPDTIVRQTEPGAFVEALIRKAMFFKYVNTLVAEGRLTNDVQVTASTVEDFERYLVATRFEYDEEAERLVRDLRTHGAANRYRSSFMDQVDQLEASLRMEKHSAVARFSRDIQSALRDEVIARTKGESARIAASLEGDVQVAAAAGLLKNRVAYGSLLTSR